MELFREDIFYTLLQYPRGILVASYFKCELKVN